MKSKQMLRPLAAILLFTVLATADSESHLLVKSKCKCLTVTSKTVVSESPTGGRVEQLMRDIKIICKNCNQKPTSPGEPQCKPEPPSADTCYSSDDKECLYHKINLGNGRQMDAVLNPECLRHERNHWIPEPTQPPVETTYDPSSMSDAP